MNTLKNRFNKSTLVRSMKVLSKQDLRRTFVVIILQVMMGLLDLIAIAVIGVLGALAVSGVQSNTPGSRVSSILRLLQLDQLPFQTQAAILGITATIILVSKTMFSILFSRRILFFLSRRGALISSVLVSKLLAQSLLVIQRRTYQETIYAITNGVNTITMGVLAAGANAISDISLLLLMSIGLFVVDPVMALLSVILFGTIGLAMYMLLHKKARNLGIKDSDLSVKSNEKITEVLATYRESVVRNTREQYSRQFGEIRFDLADTTAEIAFLPNISKYVIEITVVVGALVISAVQFVIQDASHAIATLSVFLAAGTRIAPAALRLQQGAIQIKGSLGNAERTLSLIEELGDSVTIEKDSAKFQIDHLGFVPNVKLRDINFTYPNASSPALKNVNLDIAPGEIVAIVGPSGSGKSTLIDLMLGLLNSSSGTVLISNREPAEAVKKWPGAIAYVPQNVAIVNGSVRENIALGYPLSVASDELIGKALEASQMKKVVNAMKFGMDSSVGEQGNKLSGGQRQRLGIARALFTQPKLLVLDEATSSLDGQTELDLSEAIQNLRGNATIVLVAHRLSTVRNADKVIYIKKGSIVAQGNFNEVRSAVPDFDSQAKLMGL